METKSLIREQIKQILKQQKENCYDRSKKKIITFRAVVNFVFVFFTLTIVHKRRKRHNALPVDDVNRAFHDSNIRLSHLCGGKYINVLVIIAWSLFHKQS